MRIRTNIIAIAVAAGAALSMTAEELVIMHTNDVHGNIVPEKSTDLGGVLRRKVIIDSIRHAEKHSLLVDAGDDVQGYMYFTLFKGKVEYTLMKKLGYEVVIPGNHEFDNGMQSLARNYRRLKGVDLLCANYDFSKTPLKGMLAPYTIKSYGGKNIALIGVTCDPKGMIAPENVEGVVYHNAMTVADSIADKLKKSGKADYAVVVSHIGYTADVPELPSDSVLAATSHNIDLIIGGHSHTLINPADPNHPNYLIKNKNGKTVLVAQLGRGGKYLGKITIDLDNFNKTPRYELFPVSRYYDNRLDPALVSWMKPFDKAVDKVMHDEIGKSDAAMENGTIGPLTNWVADMVYELGSRMTNKKVDLAIINKGGVRQPMPKGNVSRGLMETMLPFTNRILLMEIDGKSLQEGFDVMAQRGGDAISRQANAGMRNGKAVNVTINGQPLDPDRTYLIATIDYLAEGGDNMASFTRGKVIVRSHRLLKEDAISFVKDLTAAGKSIPSDPTERMHKEK